MRSYRNRFRVLALAGMMMALLGATAGPARRASRCRRGTRPGQTGDSDFVRSRADPSIQSTVSRRPHCDVRSGRTLWVEHPVSSQACSPSIVWWRSRPSIRSGRPRMPFQSGSP